MLFLIVLPAFVILIWAIVDLWHMQKHDIVLYRFCQIRRELMRLLRDDCRNLSTDEYRFARRMLRFLNHTIGVYSDQKRQLFGWRRLRWAMREYKLSAEAINELAAAQKNAKLNGLLEKAGNATLLGFLEYAPLLKHAVVVGFSMWTVQHIGAKLLRDSQRILAFFDVLKDQSDRYGELTAA